MSAPVAKWITRSLPKSEITGSNPARCVIKGCHIKCFSFGMTAFVFIRLFFYILHFAEFFQYHEKRRYKKHVCEYPRQR